MLDSEALTTLVSGLISLLQKHDTA